MKWLWWTLLVASALQLAYSVSLMARLRRAGTPLSHWYAGMMPNNAGFLLLIVSQLVDGEGLLVWVLLVSSLLLMAYGIFLEVVARRRGRESTT